MESLLCRPSSATNGLAIDRAPFELLGGEWRGRVTKQHATSDRFITHRHARGYRTFDNTATNIRWLALVTGGEGFHNNHHGFPRSPKFSVRRGELDPSWPIIRLLTRVKLARPYRTIEEFE